LTGDLDGLKALLADDATAMSDGGGKVKGAGLKPVHGADAVARLYLGLMKKQPAGLTAEIAELNGWPALIVRLDGKAYTAIHLETDGEKIFAVRSVVNPDKLTRI